MGNIYEYIPSKTELFSGMLSSSYNIGTWCLSYDERPVLFASTCKYQKQLENFLNVSGVLDYICQNRDIQRPVFFSDVLGCVWVGEWTDPDAEQFDNLLFVIGPVMYGANSVQNLNNLLKSMHYSQTLRDALLSVLQEIPVLEPTTFMSLGVMLHFILTGKEISMSDCVYQSAHAKGINNDEEPESDSNINYEQSEQTNEALLMRIVREGDVEGAKNCHGNKWLGKPLKLDIYDPMREMKDTLIMFIVLCSRAAMEGGLPPKIAKQMVRQYISAAESTGMPTALTDLSNTMFLDFTQRVHDVRFGPSLSKPIMTCCAYIQSNITKDINLKMLAKEIGYSEYYLSKKFAAEVGMKLSDYIKQQRIEYAKILLQTTDKGVQEISNMLRFSSRNYFSAVFQSVVGTTPAAFRSEQAKKEAHNANKGEN